MMADDSESNRIVLFGGSSGSSLCTLSDTWAYDVATNSWQDMSPAVAPPGRCCPGMAYDSATDRVILFGGAAAGATRALNDTWAYDLNANAWTDLTPAVSPPARTGGQLVYDIRLDRMILFGGHRLGGSNLAFNDTWVYDLNSNTWTQVVTATAPSLRAFPAMAYDAESDRIVLFGGETEPNSYADSETWAYDVVNETWAKMTPATSPARRFAAAADYDAAADRVLVFGGVGYPDNTDRNDTWAYDFKGDTWSEIQTATRPSNRLSAMAYDAKSGRTVLFGGSWPWGGVGESVNNRETWLLEYEISAWTMVLGPLPPVAAFSFSPTNPIPGETIQFDASASRDPDGTVALYAWDFGDGIRTGGTPATHAFATAGTKTVSLTVTDDDGLTNTLTQQVAVGPAPDTVKPTVVVASPANGATLDSKTVTITGTASDNVAVQKIELSLDGTTWTLGTGTTSWSGTLTLAEGDNTIYIRVTDTSGNTATTTVHVTVATVGGTTGGQGMPAWILPVVVVGIAAAAVAAYAILRRRRKPAAAMEPEDS